MSLLAARPGILGQFQLFAPEARLTPRENIDLQDVAVFTSVRFTFSRRRRRPDPDPTSPVPATTPPGITVAAASRVI